MIIDQDYMLLPSKVFIVTWHENMDYKPEFKCLNMITVNKLNVFFKLGGGGGGG